MKNLIYGIIGCGMEVCQGINAIAHIDNKRYTTEQNQTFAACALVAGVIGGMYLGCYIEKMNQEKEAKKKAKEAKKN